MAQIKFDKHIKKQLEDRRIQPSNASWERISGELALQHDKKKSKRVLWMSIAASFFIGVAITALLFNSKNIFTNEIVDTPVNKKMQTIEDIVKEVQVLPETKANEKIVIATATTQSQKVKAVSESVIAKQEKKKRSTQTTKKKYVVVDTGGDNLAHEEIKIEKVEFPHFKTRDIKTVNKVESVIAEVEKKELVTDQEIEDLLREAQSQIVSKEGFIGQGEMVDASALLLDVEYDLDPETFKDKIFRNLKREFGKTLDRIVNRGEYRY